MPTVVQCASAVVQRTLAKAPPGTGGRNVVVGCRECLPLVGESLTLVGESLTPVGESLTLVGESLTRVGVEVWRGFQRSKFSTVAN